MTSLSNAISALWPEPLRLVLFLVGIMAFVGAERRLPGLGGAQGRRPLPAPPRPDGSRLGRLAAAHRRRGQAAVQAADRPRRRGHHPVPRGPAADDVARPDEPGGHPLRRTPGRPEHQRRAADDLRLRVDQRHGDHARRLVFAEQIRDHLRRPRGLPERRLRNPHAAGGHHHDHGDRHDEPERDRRCSRPARSGTGTSSRSGSTP